MNDHGGSASRPHLPGDPEPEPASEPAQRTEPAADEHAGRRLRFWDSGMWWWSAVVLALELIMRVRADGVPELFDAFGMTAFLIDALLFALLWIALGLIVRAIVLSRWGRKGRQVPRVPARQRLLGFGALALLFVLPIAAISAVQQFTGEGGASGSSQEAAIAACEHAWLHSSTLKEEMSAATAGPEEYSRAASEMVYARSMVLDTANSALAEVLAGLALDITDMGTSSQLGDQAAYSRAVTGANLRASDLQALCNQAFDGGP